MLSWTQANCTDACIKLGRSFAFGDVANADRTMATTMYMAVLRRVDAWRGGEEDGVPLYAEVIVGAGKDLCLRDNYDVNVVGRKQI
jgi:hypothetical protein